MALAQTFALAAAATAGTTGLAYGAWMYAANWPTSQLFGSTVIDIADPDQAHHTVALTFDDGPSTRNTPALLDVLAGAEVHATFFMIGNHVRRHPELARRVLAAGHTLANHTQMHPNLTRKPMQRIREELQTCQQTIADITGVLPTLFRPPYGGRRPAVLRVARELGMTPIMWNVTAGDWSSPSHAALLARIDRGLTRNRKRGRTSNVLLHDASHLDGTEPHSRADTVSVVAALLLRPELRFVPVADFLPQ